LPRRGRHNEATSRIAAVAGENERRYLKNQPTSFVLPPAAVDRLRAAAGEALRASSEFQKLIRAMSQSKPPKPVAAPIQIR
jgi:hypothetical protein